MDRNTAADEIAASDGVGNMFFHNKVSLVICCRWMICAKAHPFRGTRFVFLKHVVAVRGEVVHFDERNLDSSVVSFIAQCSLDVGPAGKRGGSTAGSAKTGFFLATRQRKRALTIRRARYGGDQASACLFFRCPITVVLPVVFCPMTTSISASRGR